MSFYSHIFGPEKPLKELNVGDYKKVEIRLEFEIEALEKEIAEIERRIIDLFEEGVLAPLEKKKLLASEIRRHYQEKNRKVAQLETLMKEKRVLSQILCLKEHEHDLKASGIWEKLTALDGSELETMLNSRQIDKGENELVDEICSLTSMCLAVDDSNRSEDIDEIFHIFSKIESYTSLDETYPATDNECLGRETQNLFDCRIVPVNPSEEASINNLQSTGSTEHVHFTVTAPSMLCNNRSYIIDVWAHLDDQYDEVIRRAKEAQGEDGMRSKSKGPVIVERGSVIDVHLDVPGIQVEEPTDSLCWEGRIANAGFLINVPPDTATGKYTATCTFSVGGCRIARLHFYLTVAEREQPVVALQTEGRWIRSAFASYASEDRGEVLARIQGIRKVLPEVDIFIDIASLRSGEHWQNRLYDEIRRRDVFYLFWSQAASASEWVTMEWKTALDLKGIEYIDPVPLEPPEKAPPPPELAQLHFNDWMLAHIAK